MGFNRIVIIFYRMIKSPILFVIIYKYFDILKYENRKIKCEAEYTCTSRTYREPLVKGSCSVH